MPTENVVWKNSSVIFQLFIFSINVLYVVWQLTSLNVYLHDLDALLSDGNRVVVKTTDRWSSISNIVDTSLSSV